MNGARWHLKHKLSTDCQCVDDALQIIAYAATLLSALLALPILTGTPEIIIHVIRFIPFFVFISFSASGHMPTLACFGTLPATGCWSPNQPVCILQQRIQISI